MKKRTNWLVFPSALAISFAVTATTLAQEAVVKILPELQPDPLVVSGRSGGEKSSDCGNIADTPSQIIQVTESVPYLRFRVQSEGEPTLLIEGPQGRRFCVLADTKSGESPEIAGYWEAGKYSLYVGDRAQGHHPYTLSISRKKDSTQ
jgi:hypothetical protein